MMMSTHGSVQYDEDERSDRRGSPRTTTYGVATQRRWAISNGAVTVAVLGTGVDGRPRRPSTLLSISRLGSHPGREILHTLYAPYGQYGETLTESFEFTSTAKRVRKYLYDFFLANSTAPTPATIRNELGLDQDETWDGLHQLERANFVVFVPGTEDILKVPPFSAVPTRHQVSAADGRSWYAGCAGEACAVNGFLPGMSVTVTSTCPDCWDPITFEACDRDFLSIDQPDAVIHIGTHPRDFPKNWIATCDSINFFRDPTHVAAWEDAVPERSGVMFSIQHGLTFSAFSAKARLDYDRPANNLQPEKMVSSLKRFGADVSVWE